MRFRPAGRNPWTFPWQKKRNAKIDEAAMKLVSVGRWPWELPWEKKRSAKIREEVRMIMNLESGAVVTSVEAVKAADASRRIDKIITISDPIRPIRPGSKSEPEDDDLSGNYLAERKQAQIKKLADVLSNEGDGGIWEALDEKNSLIVAEALYRNGVRAR